MARRGFDLSFSSGDRVGFRLGLALTLRKFLTRLLSCTLAGAVFADALDYLADDRLFSKDQDPDLIQLLSACFLCMWALFGSPKHWVKISFPSCELDLLLRLALA